MRFMMMIKATKQSETGKLPSAELLTAMGKFNEELIANGTLVSGEGLHPPSQGVLLTNLGGKIPITDGPILSTASLGLSRFCACASLGSNSRLQYPQ